MQPRDPPSGRGPGKGLAPPSSLWALVEGAQRPRVPSYPWCSSTGHAGTDGELRDGKAWGASGTDDGGIIPLCLPAKVKPDSGKQANPDRPPLLQQTSMLIFKTKQKSIVPTSLADEVLPRSKLCFRTLGMSIYHFTVLST